MKHSFRKIIAVFLLLALLTGLTSGAAYAALVSEMEPNDKKETATALSFGDMITGVIASKDTCDYYKLTPSERGYAEITFTHGYIENSAPYWDLLVYRFTTKLEQIYETRLKLTHAETVLPKIGMEPGSYYIRIDNGNKYDAIINIEYHMTVDFTPTPNWEAEPNGKTEKANPIVLDETCGGFIGSADDKDYYSFIPPEHGCVTITFTHDYMENSAPYWDLLVYRFTTKLELIYQTRLKLTDAETKLPKIGVEPGSYYIRIDNGNQYDAVINIEYHMTVDFTPTPDWEAEPNGRTEEANPIALNKTCSGFTGSTDDKDYYSFTPPERGYVTITFTHDYMENSAPYWDLLVYRFTTELELIYQTRLKLTEARTELPKIGVEPGSYYIRIDNGNQYDAVINIEYHMTVDFTPTPNWEAEPNGQTKNANPIVFGETYSGNFSAADYKDYYSFTPPQRGYVTITFTHDYKENSASYCDLLVYRFTTDMEQIYKTTLKMTDAETVLPGIAVEPGSYYIRIVNSGAYSSFGNVEYSLRLSLNDRKYLLGDLDLNGRITAADARLALRGAVGLNQFDATQISIGDVNFDGRMTAADARLILRAAVGLEKLN